MAKSSTAKKTSELLYLNLKIVGVFVLRCVSERLKAVDCSSLRSSALSTVAATLAAAVIFPAAAWGIGVDASQAGNNWDDINPSLAAVDVAGSDSFSMADDKDDDKNDNEGDKPVKDNRGDSAKNEDAKNLNPAAKPPSDKDVLKVTAPKVSGEGRRRRFQVEEDERREGVIIWDKWAFKKLHSFKDWDVIVRRVGTTKFTCHAISKPLRTTVFSGIRQQPYLAIHHFGYEKFAVSGFSGFSISQNSHLSLFTNNIYHGLTVTRDFFFSGFNNFEDMFMIRNMRLDVDRIAKVYSADKSNELAIDYYSLDGINQALDYINKHCS